MVKLHNLRGIEISKFKAISSGEKTFEELFGKGGFSEWVEQHQRFIQNHIYEPVSFLWHEGDKETWGRGKNVLIYAVKDEVTPTDVKPYELIEFPGGLFLVGTGDETEGGDLNQTIDCMMSWIKQSDVFDYGDFPKSGMCNMPNPDGAFDQALGVSQQQVYLPLKYKEK
ncbi:hypothetical protein BN85402000 [Alteracholeplasma palmae J233]|uniref:Bacterial transcription activator effector binding domain-containing protein n=1 Tax=Alteracholeplasma palmae (strain ATCC 49389 / J233) TaxID=1318466 RepID=U4KJX6_ALTPJ|nr:hypothetical protein [Alteracholeplasma palmae]CCV63777.1 hypothetical protein BN85402000 [Alteracholeplasma palmae J233]